MKTIASKGPWEVRDGYGPQCDVYQNGISGTRHIAYTGPMDPKTYPEICWSVDQANAHLIAAAPDMYEALEELEESAEYWGEYDVPLGIVEHIQAALKKARGEG